MKRMFFLFASLLLAGPLFSQEYQPRDTWPFIYESFLPGATRTVDGALATEASFNIAVYDGTLMYIGADQTLMRADMSRVFSAKIGEDVYYNCLGRMYKVLSELDCGLILLGTELDESKQGNVSIGYGISSATASAQRINNLMDGRFDLIGKAYEQLGQNKFRGEPLSVKERVYFRIDATLIPASRQEVLNCPGVDKKAANAFFKQEKIKWKDTASLEKVLVFLNEQINKNQ